MNNREGTKESAPFIFVETPDSYPSSSKPKSTNSADDSKVEQEYPKSYSRGSVFLCRHKAPQIVNSYFAYNEQPSASPPRSHNFHHSSSIHRSASYSDLQNPTTQKKQQQTASLHRNLSSTSLISDFFNEKHPIKKPSAESPFSSDSELNYTPTTPHPITMSEKRPASSEINSGGLSPTRSPPPPPPPQSSEALGLDPAGRSGSLSAPSPALISRGFGKGFAALPPTEPTLLPGEIIFQRINSVSEWSTVFLGWQPGTLFLTNFQVVFIPASGSSYDDVPTFQGSVIPLLAIHCVEKCGRQSDAREHSYVIKLHCKDLRIVRFAFRPQHKTRRKVVDFLTEKISKTSQMNSFFCFQTPTDFTGRDGWLLYQVEREFQRQGALPPSAPTSASGGTISAPAPIGSGNGGGGASSGVGVGIGVPRFSPTSFRLSQVNNEWKISETYPSELVVPASIGDEILVSVAGFRSKGRIPALTWMHPITGACLFRSSQPMTGIIRSNKDDQKLLEAMSNINASETTGRLVIIDLRPKPNAYANMAMGMGFESSAHYRTSELRFKGIENIHVMRESFRKMYEICITTGGADPQWYSKIESTNWLEHVRTVLAVSAATADVLEREKNHVLAHCSDGWDRTAQVCCLAQIMLDPYYRTIEGFGVLIEKDWLSFGHKFHTRVGHGQANFYEDQRGPIFLQFMDAIYQMTLQFPLHFEFNENFLRFVLDSLYSCRFGTFLYDTHRERLTASLPSLSLSIWSHVDQNKPEFTNPFYERPASCGPSTTAADFHCSSYQRGGAIYPDTSPFAIRFWGSYYLRFSRNPHGGALVGSGSGGGSAGSAPGSGGGSGSGTPGSLSPPSETPTTTTERASIGPGMLGALSGGSAGGPPLVTLSGFFAGDHVCFRGVEMSQRIAQIDEARRMVTIRNEAAVLSFQRETKKLLSNIERLQKENRALQDKFSQISGGTPSADEKLATAPTPETQSPESSQSAQKQLNNTNEQRGRAGAVWGAQDSAERARCEYLEKELTYLRLRYEQDISELQKRMKMASLEDGNDGNQAEGHDGLFGLSSDSFELARFGGGGGEASGSTSISPDQQGPSSQDKLKKVDEIWQHTFSSQPL